MALSNSILNHLKRINATLPQSAAGDAIELLTRHVVWPNVAFTGSTERMRRYLADQGLGDVAAWSEERLRDEMPSLYEFQFLQPDSRGKFWDGWEDQFASVDSTKLVPFATDDYYFYFLSYNTDDDSDPCMYSVDHEETDEEPYDEGGLTVSRLLSVIESAET